MSFKAEAGDHKGYLKSHVAYNDRKYATCPIRNSPRPPGPERPRLMTSHERDLLTSPLFMTHLSSTSGHQRAWEHAFCFKEKPALCGSYMGHLENKALPAPGLRKPQYLCRLGHSGGCRRLFRKYAGCWLPALSASPTAVGSWGFPATFSGRKWNPSLWFLTGLLSPRGTVALCSLQNMPPYTLVLTL